jgi:hypothetical protein
MPCRASPRLSAPRPAGCYGHSCFLIFPAYCFYCIKCGSGYTFSGRLMGGRAATSGAFGSAQLAARGLIPSLSPEQRHDQATRDLRGLMPALEQAIVPDPARQPPSLAPPRPATGSRPPWNPQAAHALLLARDTLLHRASARTAEHALYTALLALGLREPWRPLPRTPGSPIPRCPFSCGLPSLRMAPLQGLVRCVTPVCLDSGEPGRRPRAEMTPVYAGDGEWYWILLWDDGTKGLPERKIAA